MTLPAHITYKRSRAYGRDVDGRHAPIEQFITLCRLVSEKAPQEVSDGQIVNVDSIHSAGTGRLGGRSYWPLQGVSPSSALGELLEPAARDGGGNQQPSHGSVDSTVEGSETRVVSNASNNQPHERPAPLCG